MTRYTMPARSQGNAFMQHTMARNDEAVEVNARGLNARDAVKALIEATGLNPYTDMCGRPFCSDDLDDVDGARTGEGAV